MPSQGWSCLAGCYFINDSKRNFISILPGKGRGNESRNTTSSSAALQEKKKLLRLPLHFATTSSNTSRLLALSPTSTTYLFMIAQAESKGSAHVQVSRLAG